jgi:DNA transformation protein
MIATGALECGIAVSSGSLPRIWGPEKDEYWVAEITSLNLGKAMDKKLKSVGICSAEALQEIGSKEAVFRLKAQYPSTCVVVLYHLEAALQGVKIKELDSSCKAELKAFFNQIKDAG